MPASYGDYIYILVVKAEGVIIADKGGTSDPYCDVFLDSDPRKVKSTKVIDKTLNPVWNDRMSFKRPSSGKATASFEVWDKDFMNKDFLGEVVNLEVGDVPEGEVREQTLALAPREGKMKLKYVGELNTSYGKLTFKISSGHMKECPDLNAIMSDKEILARQNSMSSPDASGAPRKPSLLQQISGTPTSFNARDEDRGLSVSEAQKYIYVRPISAKNLVPMDKNGKSDPYCKVSLNTCKHTRKTDSLKATLNPEWQQMEPFSFPFTKDSRTILIEIFDQDGMGFDDEMGRVQLPVDESTIQNPGELKSGWYDIMPSPNSRTLKKEYERRPEKLGKIQIVYSVGYLKNPPASKELQPAFRTKMGKLKVEVMELVDLRPDGINVDDIYLKVLFEGRIDQSSKNHLLKGDRCEINEAWEFDVTEIMADLTIELWDADLITADDRFGKVIVPLKSLWHFAGSSQPRWETWLLVMPGGKKRCPIVTTQDRPKKPIGALKVALTFKLNPNMLAPIVYVGNKLLIDNTAVSTEVEASVPNLLGEVGRVVDAILSPLTSGIAVMLYLQSWKDTKLNVILLVATWYGYFWIYSICDYLMPFLVITGICIQGYILRQIRMETPVFIFNDEKARVMEGITEMSEAKQSAAAAYEKAMKRWQSKCNEMYMDETEMTLAENQVVKKKFKKNKEDKKAAASSIPGFAQWYAVQGLMKSVQSSLASISAAMEKLGNSLVWKDETVSFYTTIAMLALGVVLTIIWVVVLALARALCYINPFTWAHLGFMFVIFLQLPLATWTAPIVALIDGILLDLPIPLSPCSWESVPILTEKYRQQLEELRDGGAEDQRLKTLAEAEAKQKAEDKKREQEEIEWQRQEGGMDKLMQRRLRDPITLLTNLYNRSPTNLDHLHRCRCVRHIIPRPYGGHWPKLPADQPYNSLIKDMLCNSNAKYYWDNMRMHQKDKTI